MKIVAWIVVIAVCLVVKLRIKEMGGYSGNLAFEVVSSHLRDPQGTQINSGTIVWKSKDASVVDLDLTGKNGFGGSVRQRFCVCLDEANKAGAVLSDSGGCGPSSRTPASDNPFVSQCQGMLNR